MDFSEENMEYFKEADNAETLNSNEVTTAVEDNGGEETPNQDGK
jgi:hypothetical protein